MNLEYLIKNFNPNTEKTGPMKSYFDLYVDFYKIIIEIYDDFLMIGTNNTYIELNKNIENLVSRFEILLDEPLIKDRAAPLPTKRYFLFKY